MKKYPGEWDLPGGHLQVGEENNLIAGLKREVYEEINFALQYVPKNNQDKYFVDFFHEKLNEYFWKKGVRYQKSIYNSSEHFNLNGKDSNLENALDSNLSYIDFIHVNKLLKKTNNFKGGDPQNNYESKLLDQLKNIKLKDPEQVENMAKRAIGLFKKIDILINNAAGNFISPTENLSSNAFKTVVDIVLNGTFHCTQSFGKHMRKMKNGVILNIVTTYAWTG